jgi:hypothetical protein
VGTACGEDLFVMQKMLGEIDDDVVQTRLRVSSGKFSFGRIDNNCMQGVDT